MKISTEQYIPTQNITITKPTTILKRDGRIVPFDNKRIENAIARCFISINKKPGVNVDKLSNQVVNIISAKHLEPNVENVQDVVEIVLQAAGEYEAAKNYILYRAEHAKMRQARPVPEEVKLAFEESEKYFPNPIQQFQFYDKYSRFDYNTGRRETWIETVDRAMAFLKELSEFRLSTKVYEQIRSGILQMKVMPSMRLLAMAGPA